MDFLNSVYSKSSSDNEKSLSFWQEHLNDLKSLNFNEFTDKMKVPVMVPVGNKIMFKGHLQHTNEIMIALGADYFVKCSAKQAEIIRQHRIKVAQSKVDAYMKEKELINNRMTFNKQFIQNAVGQEILEEYTEKEDEEWRKKHRENVRKYKMQSKNEKNINSGQSDQQFWIRLEELELQEEIENEFNNANTNKHNNEGSKKLIGPKILSESIEKPTAMENYEMPNQMEPKTSPVSTNVDLFQQILDKQNELREMLQNIKEKDEVVSKTETDLITRLDKMELFDEVEDEINRIDDIIHNEVEYLEEQDNNEITPPIKITRSVSFADEDDSECIDITFKHSAVRPSSKPYKPETGIQKPSDLYYAYKDLFGEETTSILKKTNYDKTPTDIVSTQELLTDSEVLSKNKTILIKDVTEKVNTEEDSRMIIESRPISLFRKRRIQSKT